MAYKILCSVSGGVTGSRSAYLKVNGAECEYESLKDAQVQAEWLQANVSPYSTASFSYRAVEV